MIKFVLPKTKWHITIIVGIVLILSIASWFLFIKGIGSKIIHRFSDNKENIVISIQEDATIPAENKISFPAEQPGQTSIYSKITGLIDKGINYIDGHWSVVEKSSLSKIDSLITYYGTGAISSSQVIEGSDKWLFYRGRGDGMPIEDYEGTNLYTQSEMEKTAIAAIWTQDELSKRGIIFTILIAPNKENIYSEYMPDMYTHAEQSRVDILVEYLKSKGVNVIWPKDELLDNHLSSQVYYRYDTHWNQLGAYIGVRSTLSAWNISMPELSNRSVLAKELKGNYHICGGDDLAKMAGLRSVFSDEVEYEVSGTVLMDWQTFETEQSNSEISHFHNESAANNVRVLLVGDSFRSSMVPSLREQFADVYVVHRSYYTPEMLDQVNPDYLIAEYVERYSDDLRSVYSLLN